MHTFPDNTIQYNKKMKILGILFLIILLILVSKMIWVAVMTRHIGTFESERTDVLLRCSYLLEKVVVEPETLVSSMPSAVGHHFQGE